MVALDAAPRGLLSVVAARTFDATDIAGVAALVAGAREHRDRRAHRAEHRTASGRRVDLPEVPGRALRRIALGQDAGIWVPWVTPADPAKVAGWMQVGFDLWTALRR